MKLQLVPKPVITKKRYRRRCKQCVGETMTGKACNPARCLCKCHQMTKGDEEHARNVQVLAEQGWFVPMSFDEELAVGHFGEMKPKPVGGK